MLESSEQDTIEHKVPFETESKLQEDSYIKDVFSFVDWYSQTQMSNLDVNILKELYDKNDLTQQSHVFEISNNGRLELSDV